MNCPACASAMENRVFEGNYGVRVELDLCHPCSALWFDDKENLQLSPGGTLHLFQAMHVGRADRTQLPASMKCPRCDGELVATQDLQRSTRFNYHRCPQRHGRFITFFQFMREKNFVRSLDPKELNALRAHMKTINCSNCGAPVDLEKEASCEYCQAPLSSFDPKQIELTVKQLEAEDSRRKNVDPNVAAKLIMDRLGAETFYQQLAPKTGGNIGVRYGLVEAGLGVMFDVLGSLFR